MRVLQGRDLSQCIRDLSDACKSTVRIASPYIGNWTVVECLLGNQWWNKAGTSVRLLTDEHVIHVIGKQTLKRFSARIHGSTTLKTLLGLHAKLYAFDDLAIVTSANFTKTAFTRRREAGVLLDGEAAEAVVKMFDSWFDDDGKVINPGSWTIEGNSGCQKSEEPEAEHLPVLYKLPERARITLKDTEEQKNESYLNEYSKLVRICESCGRISSFPSLFT